MDNELLNKLTSNTNAINKIQDEISQAISRFKDELENKQNENNELKKAIKVAMIDNGVKKLENDVLSIVYIAPTTRISIDTKKLKEDNPELWEEYSKTSKVKDSIRIKVKNQGIKGEQ